MAKNIIQGFQKIKDDMEQKGYTKEQQLCVLIPLFEDITNSLLDLLKTEKDKYDDLVAKFQFLRALDGASAENKEKYYKVERYMRNTLIFLGTKSRETADGLNEIIQGCMKDR